MLRHYKVIEEKGFLEEHGEFQTFGLRIEEDLCGERCPNGDKLPFRREILILHDVTTDIDLALKIERIFNEEQPEDVHLMEVLDEMFNVNI